MADESECPTSRDELIEARARVQRQIEVLEAGPVLARDWSPQTPELIARLKVALVEIDAEIADMGSEEPEKAQARQSTSPIFSGHRSWWQWLKQS